MNWSKEVTIHRTESGGAVKVDYTGVFVSDGGAKVTARRAPDSAEVSFVITHDKPDALDDRKIEQIAEVIARALEGVPTGEELRQKLDELVNECALSVRTANCCDDSGLVYVGQLVQKSEHDLLMTKNFGRKSLKEVRDALSSMGLMLGMKPSQLDGWTPPGTPAT